MKFLFLATLSTACISESPVLEYKSSLNSNKISNQDSRLVVSDNDIETLLKLIGSTAN